MEQVLEHFKKEVIFNKMRVNFKELREERLKQIEIDLKKAFKHKNYKFVKMLLEEKKNILKQLKGYSENGK